MAVPRTGFRRSLNDLYDYLDDQVPQGDQASHIADASTAHDVTGVDGQGSNAASKDDVDDALDALGTKINSILAALEEFGITASS